MVCCVSLTRDHPSQFTLQAHRVGRPTVPTAHLGRDHTCTKFGVPRHRWAVVLAHVPPKACPSLVVSSQSSHLYSQPQLLPVPCGTVGGPNPTPTLSGGSCCPERWPFPWLKLHQMPLEQIQPWTHGQDSPHMSFQRGDPGQLHHGTTLCSASLGRLLRLLPLGPQPWVPGSPQLTHPGHILLPAAPASPGPTGLTTAPCLLPSLIQTGLDLPECLQICKIHFTAHHRNRHVVYFSF